MNKVCSIENMWKSEELVQLVGLDRLRRYPHAFSGRRQRQDC